jgi:hypothetical protein
MKIFIIFACLSVGVSVAQYGIYYFFPNISVILRSWFQLGQVILLLGYFFLLVMYFWVQHGSTRKGKQSLRE